MSDTRPGVALVRVITSSGQPFAVLAEGPRGRFLLPPVIRDLAGNLVETPARVARIVGCRPGVQIPVVQVGKLGDLASIDQRLTGLRIELGAQPWPPLDPR